MCFIFSFFSYIIYSVFQLIQIFVELRNSERSGSSAVVGLDHNIVRVLMQLMNILDGDDSNNELDPTAVSDAVFRQNLEVFFSKLDLDGDGIISWWEWKQVLHAASLIRCRVRTKYLDHLDPLIVGFLAANASMEALRISDPSGFARSAMGTLKSSRIVAWGDQEKGDIDSLLAQLPPESRGRLADSIAALRKSKDSHLNSALQHGKSLDEEANARIRVAREEANNAKRELDDERHKRSLLESEIGKIKETNSAMSKSRAEVEAENQRVKEQLKRKADENKELVALAHWNRIKKLKAANKIRRFMVEGVARLRKRKLAEGEAYMNQMKHRRRSAVVIQRRVRGNQGRRRVAVLWHSISVLQRALRNRKDRINGRKSFARLVSEMNRAANKLQSALRNRMSRQKETQKRHAVQALEAKRRALALDELVAQRRKLNSIIRIQAHARRL